MKCIPLLAVVLAACGDDPERGGLAQLDDAASTLELPPRTSTTTSPDTSSEDTRDTDERDTDERDTDERDTDERDTAIAPDTTVAPDADADVGPDPCGPDGPDCDDGDPCTEDRCVPDSNDCTNTPIVCAPSQVECQVAVCKSDAGGCTLVPVEGSEGCDDGEGCTVADVCKAGTCVGELKSCDDLDPCTTDACIDGGCTATPIPNCSPDEQCDDELPGTHCDDGSALTSGDLCLGGSCRGFATARVDAGVVQAVGVVVHQIDFGQAGWTAVLWGLEANQVQSWSLAKINTASQPVPYEGTRQSAQYAGLFEDYVGDSDGYLWERVGNAWTIDNIFDDGLFWSDRGVITDLFTVVDVDEAGDALQRKMWLVGNDGVDEWIRYCAPDPFLADEILCEEQELDDFDASSLPKAMAGIQDCRGDEGCHGALVATAADAAASGGAYTDTYENMAPGIEARWDKGATPNTAAQRTSRAIAAWGSIEDAQFLAVGTNGYMVHRRTNGSWSAPLLLNADQLRRTFSGVWVGAGVIAVSAHYVPLLDNSRVEYELWTCPTNKDVELGSNWTVHSLGSGGNVTAAGLYDVSGRQDGELRLVGAIRKGQSGPLLDGLVYVRAP